MGTVAVPGGSRKAYEAKAHWTPSWRPLRSCGKAIRRARTAGLVELKLARRDGRIRIEARDDCPERPVPSSLDSPTRHRGLMLVEDLSEEWGCDLDDGHGKVVWFEVPAT